MIRLWIALAALATCLCVSPAFGAGATLKQANAQYRRAIEDARAGRTGPALESLHTLVELLPNRQDILCDYAVVLGWAGEHAAAHPATIQPAKEIAMDWDCIEDNWDDFKVNVKQQWSDLTDTQLEKVAGRRDSLVGEIEEIYGISRHAAEWQLSGWQERLKDPGVC